MSELWTANDGIEPAKLNIMCEKGLSYIIRKKGSYYEALNGTNSQREYGGEDNDGSVSGSNPAAIVNACVDALTDGYILLKGKGETWPLSEQITVDTKNISLHVEPILQATTGFSDTKLIYYNAAADCDLYFACIDGNNTVNTASTYTALHFLDCDNIHTYAKFLNQPCRDVSFYTGNTNMKLRLHSENNISNGTGSSIYVGNSGNLNLDISGYVADVGNQAIYANSDSTGRLHDFTVETESASGTSTALDFRSNSEWTLKDVAVDDPYNGLYVEAGAIIRADLLKITNARQYGILNFGALYGDKIYLSGSIAHQILVRGGSDRTYLSDFEFNNTAASYYSLRVNSDSSGIVSLNAGTLLGTNGVSNGRTEGGSPYPVHVTDVDFSALTGTQQAGDITATNCRGYT